MSKTIKTFDELLTQVYQLTKDSDNDKLNYIICLLGLAYNSGNYAVYEKIENALIR